MFAQLLTKVRRSVPLIHCITNYVTANDVANMLLATGSSPIMAEAVEEVEEVTSLCQGLVINLGTLNKDKLEAMLLAGKRANVLGHPVVLDPVGIGASTWRREAAYKLLEEISFTVIKGNSSEIKILAKGTGKAQGVDASQEDQITKTNLEEKIQLAKAYSQKLGCAIVMTGVVDLVTDDRRAYVVKNGHTFMSKITGAGCMLAGIIAAYCSVQKESALEAVAAAVAAMGYCGELAYKKLEQTEGGTSSYRMYLIDAMSKLQEEDFRGGCQIESR